MRLPRKRPPNSVGRMLKFFMGESEITFEQLEKHVGWPDAQLEKLLNDDIELSTSMALDLADTWGNSAEFWLNVRNSSQLWHAMQSHTSLPSIY